MYVILTQKRSLSSPKRAYKFILQVLLVLSGLFYVLLTPAYAEGEITRSESELKTLQKKISLVKRNIAKQREDENVLLLEVKKIEQQITQLQESRLRSESRLIRSNKQMEQLQEELKTIRAKTNDMQQKLAQVVRARYLLQDQNIVKLILNQENPENVSRSFIYYQRIARAGDRFIKELNQQKQQLAQVSEQLTQTQQQINQSIVQIKQQEEQIEQKKQQRNTQITEVRAQLKKQGQQVSAFERRENELQLLLKQLYRSQEQRKQAEQKELARRAAEAARQAAKQAQEQEHEQAQSGSTAASEPAVRRLSGNFAQGKGQMDLPLSGKVVQRFGEKDQESGIKNTGVLIKAKEGQSVHAIHTGQIVYADWFRGYGQLIVIDHGQGYMSLYGHNQMLLAKIGDVVEMGQPIARAGSTGGLTFDGLYFEIRVQGEPSDPLVWCRA